MTLCDAAQRVVHSAPVDSEASGAVPPDNCRLKSCPTEVLPPPAVVVSPTDDLLIPITTVSSLSTAQLHPGYRERSKALSISFAEESPPPMSAFALPSAMLSSNSSGEAVSTNSSESLRRLSRQDADLQTAADSALMSCASSMCQIVLS